MRSIDLAPYKTGKQVIVVATVDKNGDQAAEEVVEDEEFDIRKSLVACLFADQRIDPRELLRRDKLATVIEEWDGDDLLLEEADWDCIQRGLIVAATNDRAAVEFVRRVLEAPEVKVRADNADQVSG